MVIDFMKENNFEFTKDSRDSDLNAIANFIHKFGVNLWAQLWHDAYNYMIMHYKRTNGAAHKAQHFMEVCEKIALDVEVEEYKKRFGVLDAK
jgi:2,4-dienoyl-CoA reductase-like NADH-dependent reductase (Old Yellow Enzyme family)